MNKGSFVASLLRVAASWRASAQRSTGPDLRARACCWRMGEFLFLFAPTPAFCYIITNTWLKGIPRGLTLALTSLLTPLPSRRAKLGQITTNSERAVPGKIDLIPGDMARVTPSLEGRIFFGRGTCGTSGSFWTTRQPRFMPFVPLLSFPPLEH
ncbi:hypothetical protein C8F04DRAFT_99325 [Mycena alexandri]|uniref:Uncharacterized protein n=1 Tax=Mycena alexandri TaxID=1745969 RepID=A0AAD6SGB5_9AGAR|nr:hypothetical protein C8F04DRAFT_99325 [Mycena alexandri]